MEMAENSTKANVSSPKTAPTAKTSPSRSNFKRKSRFKRKGRHNAAKKAHIAPDIDIVSGFAFLSFSNVEDLEHHINETETKSRSLSINVGQKRKIQAKPAEKVEETVRISSKRVRIPSQKVLESYATNDFPLTQLVPPQQTNFNPKLNNPKPKISPESKPSSLCVNVRKSRYSESEYRFPDNIHAPNSTDEDFSLVCSETLDNCTFDDDEYKPNVDRNSNFEKSVEKKAKKKKMDEVVINDTSCQTMFRIKKKKKKRRQEQDTKLVDSSMYAKNPVIDVINTTEIAHESEQVENNEYFDSPVDMATVDIIDITPEIEDVSSKERYKQLQATKFFDTRYSKCSNKVEKIDYCARSGGVDLVERHHQRQARLKDENDEFIISNSSCQFPIDDDNLSSISDNSNSGNEYSGASLDLDSFQKELKAKIFAGSSSIFLSNEEEEEIDSEIDICDGENSSNSTINIVKALPRNYLFGHFSQHPDESTDGTIDVSIQIYDNDIQLYMNYASDFNGQIIKIITPDNDGITKSGNSCVPHSSQTGVPKFLPPQEYAKAVRSATERNRRHNLGDLFNHLKNEVFGNVRDFYFSKQSILSKALEVISSEDQQYYQLNKEKAKLCSKNQILRDNLNKLLFGDTTECSKKVDVDKVTDYLETINIKIKLPDVDNKKEEKDKNSPEQDDISKQVTKKGRPPTGGGVNLLRKIVKPQQPDIVINKLARPYIQIPQQKADKKEPEKTVSSKLTPPIDEKLSTFVPIQPKQPPTPEIPIPHPTPSVMDVAISNKVKEFVTIAPRGSEKSASVQEKEVVVTADKPYPDTTDGASVSSLDKIVCNISSYRVQQPGSGSGMTVLTNPIQPLKAMDSKNVLHIKISNDTMKQMSDLKTSQPMLNVNQAPQITASTPNKVSSAQGTQTIDSPPEMDNPVSSSTESPESEFLLTNKPWMCGKPTILTVKSKDSLKKLVSILKGQTVIQKAQNTVTASASQGNSMLQDKVSQSFSTSGIQAMSSVAQVKMTPNVVAMATQPQLQGATVIPVKKGVPVPLQSCVQTHKGSGALTPARNIPIAPAPANHSAAQQIGKMTTVYIPQPKTSSTSTSNVAIAPEENQLVTQQMVTIATKNAIPQSQGIVTMATLPNIAIAPVSHGNSTHQGILTAGNQNVSKAAVGAVSIATKGLSTNPTIAGQVSVQQLVKKPLVAAQSEHKLITVLPQSASFPSHGQTNIAANHTQSIRLLFKQTGKPIFNTPTDQVKGALQSQRLLRIPIASGAILPQQSTPNPLQAPRVRFLLQNNNQQTRTQPISPKTMVQLKPKPQPIQPKPFVKIQPQPQMNQNPVTQPTACLPSTSITSPFPSTSTQPSDQTTAKNTEYLAASSTSILSSLTNMVQATTQINAPANQTHVVPLQHPVRQAVNPIASQMNTSNDCAFDNSTTISHQQNAQLLQQQQTKVVSDGSTATKQTIFTGMPSTVSPTLQPNASVQDSFGTKRMIPLEASAMLQRMPTSSAASLKNSHTVFSSMSMNSMSSASTGIPSNISSEPGKSTMSCSSSVAVPFLSSPKEDKTCSVVESTADNSNVVTADTLSTWNIESTIPDITNEL